MMRIRYKLLILLMLIALAPLLVVRTSVQRDLTRMGDNLAERSENVLVHKASNGLKRIVEDHARVLRRERQLLESTSLLLASKIEGMLYGHAHTPHEGAFIPSDVRMEDVLEDYFTMHMGGRKESLEVDFQKVEVVKGETSSAIREGLVPLLGKVKFEYPQLVLWMEMTMADGTQVVYPKAGKIRKMRSSRMAGPAEVRLRGEIAWSLPQPDLQTRRMAFRVTAPIRDEHGNLQGNLTLVVPVDSVLHKNLHVSMFSEATESFLVAPVVELDQVTTRLRIVAQEQAQQSGRGHWLVPDVNQWMESGDAEQFGIMTTGLRAGKPGVVGMPYKDENALWAYAPVDESGTSLLLVVPMEDIVKEAQAARDYVIFQVGEHNTKMGLVVLLVAGLAVLIALLLSKLFTRNITELVEMVRNVAKGNFSVRATVRSSDEIGQLGLAINKMVPELQERVAMKNHLEVAQEVQQSLLPSETPSFPGVDIAAVSTYCDETGGDYYGFIPRGSDGDDGLVVAVGDVSGHGFQAALMMASARAYLRSQAANGKPLNEVVSRVNELMADDLDGSGRFMTLFLLEMSAAGPVKWVRAGHDPALLFDPAAGTFEELAGEGLPLGVIPDVEFEIRERTALEPGQIVIIGTDGIWETKSPSGELFGKERLQDIVRNNPQGTAAELIGLLQAALDTFRGDAGKLDDMTIAIVKIQ